MYLISMSMGFLSCSKEKYNKILEFRKIFKKHAFENEIIRPEGSPKF